jgi:hypothetical protein
LIVRYEKGVLLSLSTALLPIHRCGCGEKSFCQADPLASRQRIRPQMTTGKTCFKETYMKFIEQNVGLADRIIRVGLSIALAIFVIQSPTFGAFEVLLIVAAALLFLSATFARCYVWYVFGVSTCGYRRTE